MFSWVGKSFGRVDAVRANADKIRYINKINQGVQEYRKYVFREGTYASSGRWRKVGDNTAGNARLSHHTYLPRAVANKVMMSLNETAVLWRRITLRPVTPSLCRGCETVLTREQHLVIFQVEAGCRTGGGDENGPMMLLNIALTNRCIHDVCPSWHFSHFDSLWGFNWPEEECSVLCSRAKHILKVIS